jgi:hypothetical protein
LFLIVAMLRLCWRIEIFSEAATITTCCERESLNFSLGQFLITLVVVVVVGGGGGVQI